jgi:hypothetical protein
MASAIMLTFGYQEINGRKFWDGALISNMPLRELIEEHIKCGRSCLMCPHGPYYYAYWKDENGRLRKKYIGSKFDPSWKKQLTVKKNTKASKLES